MHSPVVRRSNPFHLVRPVLLAASLPHPASAQRAQPTPPPSLQGPALRLQLLAVPVANRGGPYWLPAWSCDLPHCAPACLPAGAREEAGTVVQETQLGLGTLSTWPGRKDVCVCVCGVVSSCWASPPSFPSRTCCIYTDTPIKSRAGWCHLLVCFVRGRRWPCHLFQGSWMLRVAMAWAEGHLAGLVWPLGLAMAVLCWWEAERSLASDQPGHPEGGWAGCTSGKAVEAAEA